MQNFEWKLQTKLYFGENALEQLPAALGTGIKTILLLYGGASIKINGLYDNIIRLLSECNLRILEFGGIQPNPLLSKVYAGIELCRKESVDLILAVGGGSVIDTAKAIGIGVPYQGDVWDFFCKKSQPRSSVPVATVLTIPAAGSEMSNGAVITKDDGMFKRDVTAEFMRPVFSILSPRITYTLPAFQTACGICDIMAHAMERYFTNTTDVALTDAMGEALLRTVIQNAPLVLNDPEHYAARSEIMLAGALAHNDLLGLGRIGDWASHNIEHELSSKYGIAHGAGLAIIFPAWMTYVRNHNIDRFAQFAREVFHIHAESSEAAADAGILALRQFFDQIGLPTTLRQINALPEDLPELADHCSYNPDGTVGNFVKLSRDDVLAIYQLAM